MSDTDLSLKGLDNRPWIRAISLNYSMVYGLITGKGFYLRPSGEVNLVTSKYCQVLASENRCQLSL